MLHCSLKTSIPEIKPTVECPVRLGLLSVFRLRLLLEKLNEQTTGALLKIDIVSRTASEDDIFQYSNLENFKRRHFYESEQVLMLLD